MGRQFCEEKIGVKVGKNDGNAVSKKGHQLFTRKKRHDRHLPPRVTPTLVRPLSFSVSHASSTYVRVGLCRPVKISQKTLCQALITTFSLVMMIRIVPYTVLDS